MRSYLLSFQVLFSHGYLNPETRKALRLLFCSPVPLPGCPRSAQGGGGAFSLTPGCEACGPAAVLWDEASISWRQGRTAATASCRWELSQKRNRKLSWKAEQSLGLLGVSVRPRGSAVFIQKHLRVCAGGGEVF